MKYFVCYTTRDKEITLDILRSFSFILERSSETFIDLIHNDSENKQARVLRELDDSDLVILVDSPKCMTSKWVMIEMGRAMARNIPIISITIDELINVIKSNTNFEPLNFKQFYTG
jgi:hypothetical protein